MKNYVVMGIHPETRRFTQFFIPNDEFDQAMEQVQIALTRGWKELEIYEVKGIDLTLHMQLVWGARCYERKAQCSIA